MQEVRAWARWTFWMLVILVPFAVVYLRVPGAKAFLIALLLLIDLTVAVAITWKIDPFWSWLERWVTGLGRTMSDKDWRSLRNLSVVTFVVIVTSLVLPVVVSS